jgi:AcrR family transcriptional regulator
VSDWTVDDGPAPTTAAGREVSTRGRRTRRRLLDAAEAVFAEYGYPEASIVKITEAAGVAQGTFYVYFPGKQAIFDEVVDDLNQRVRRAMSQAAAGGTDRADVEERGFRAFFAFTAEHPALYRVIRQAEFASPGALRRHYERIAEGYVQGLERAMDAGEIARQDPEVIAWALMGMGELLGMRWMLWTDPDAPPELPEEAFQELLAFVRRGLGTGGTT